MGSFALMVTKVNFINTKELVRLCVVEYKKIIDIPHMVIPPPQSYKPICSQLKYWENYINFKGRRNTKLEDLPTELGRGFGM